MQQYIFPLTLSLPLPAVTLLRWTPTVCYSGALLCADSASAIIRAFCCLCSQLVLPVVFALPTVRLSVC